MDKDNRNGFTLIEILIAILILAVCILGIMALLPNDLRLITSSGRISALNHIAQQTLDQLRARPVSSLDLQQGVHPSTGCGSAWNGKSIYGNCPQTFPLTVTYTLNSGERAYSDDYTISWIVTDNDPRPGMTRVEVSVGYRIGYDGNGNAVDPTVTRASDQRLVRVSTNIE